VRQHCTQCLSEILGGGEQTPTGEMLCSSCHSALWGPKTTDEFRGMVALHMGSPMVGRMVTETAR
jgi:hypothetical protein